MKAARIALTALAIAFAAFLAFRGCRPSPPPAPASSPQAAGDTQAAPWSPFQDVPKPAAPAPAPADKPKPEAAPDPVSVEPACGASVAPGADVSVVVPYATGTKSRYRVMTAETQRDRGTGAGSAAQWFWDVSAEVVQGAGDGAARIRFRTESFRFRTDGPTGLIEFDSEHPDAAMLADETFSRVLKPLLAIKDLPLEFTIDAGNAMRAVDGVDAMSRRYVDAVERLGAKFTTDVSDAPTAESLTERWSELLFPPLGGGKIAASSPRDADFRRTYLERWQSVTSGKMSVTHDAPGLFRVEFKGTPQMTELNRPAKGAAAAGVVKARVVASADSYTASWCFDRAKGRLLHAQIAAKFRLDVSRTDAAGTGGPPELEPTFTDVERLDTVDLLDK